MKEDRLIAEIVIDVDARELRDKLFTYAIPSELENNLATGTQVLVPFGSHQLTGGYVVSLGKESQKAPFPYRLKEIAEIVDPVPLFDSEYIDFLHWLAFQSCSTLQEVIQAALPSCIAPRLKRLARLAPGLSQETVETLIHSPDKGISSIIRMLAPGKKEISIPTLRRRLKKSAPLSEKSDQKAFYRALNTLKQDRVIEIITEHDNRATAKIVRDIELAAPCHENGNSVSATKRQKEIIALLESRGGKSKLAQLIKDASTGYPTIQKMVDQGLLVYSEREVLRDPMSSIAFIDVESTGSNNQETPDPTRPTLTADQEKCLSVLSGALENQWPGSDRSIEKCSPPDPWLLHGVTGSGKTEIYMRLIEKCLYNKKTALMLVPEISLTPQLASRLKDRFGSRVSVWHSAISDGERYDTWRRLRTGEVTVLLGARSAVLAHIPNLGLIILDEEHDSSYKQSSPSPRYNAREVALERARRQGALVLLGSATPDLVTYYRANQKNRIVELPKRILDRPLPKVAIVDMRKELLFGNRSIFSRTLEKSIREVLERGEQIILLMNRRGYASHVFCRACGHVVECKHCSVSMVFHRFHARLAGVNSGISSNAASTRAKVAVADQELRGYLCCHHCGFEMRAAIECPECKSPFIKEYGLGTQRVEEFVHEKFPQARTCRLDSDITSRKGAYRDVFEQFKNGKADILIGTQMVAKGLDIANVTLVGVLVADAALNMPDYRSSERGFQLLSQVAGRAGRGTKPGEVIFQTYNSELDVLLRAKDHDFKSFYESEIENRRAFAYPPFSRIFRLVVSGADVLELEKFALTLKERIQNFMSEIYGEKSFELLGPAPCLIERVKGRFRMHLLLKLPVLESAMPSKKPKRITIERAPIKNQSKQLGLFDLSTMDKLSEIPTNSNLDKTPPPSPESDSESAPELRSRLELLLEFLRNEKTPKEISLAIDVDAIDLL